MPLCEQAKIKERICKFVNCVLGTADTCAEVAGKCLGLEGPVNRLKLPEPTVQGQLNIQAPLIDQGISRPECTVWLDNELRVT